MWWKAKQTDGEDDSARPLVVMVDDEPDLCEVVRLSLKTLNIEFATAHDGEQGLALIRARRPALVILDIKMPVLNGYQVLTRMQQDPALMAIPVIVLSILNDTPPRTEEEWARRLRVSRFVAKPVDAETILRVVLGQLGAREK